MNLTVETLVRYAEAVGKRVIFSLTDIEVAGRPAGFRRVGQAVGA